MFRLTETASGARHIVGYRKVVGRLPGCPIQLLGVTVSRKHCTVEEVDGQYVLVRDLGSVNGTFVNGKRVIGEARVFPGSDIVVGTFCLLVEEVDPVADGVYQAVTPVRCRLPIADPSR